ncbi:hypothetical protein [Spirochaeta lutea]|uniref:Uncharacterized protein n=1 Tax=Spirochaeta lutea TaxID=1480694 RepID=A0A098QXS9_9SPIO|nr:hypothetical protein [Spirochaeta lutea]KGE71277.1 hypothetical protein DC28_12630 [Spirochaeta lutea]
MKELEEIVDASLERIQQVRGEARLDRLDRLSAELDELEAFLDRFLAQREASPGIPCESPQSIPETCRD